MSDAVAATGEEGGGTAERFKARHALLKRLADVVSLPASRINAFERSVTGDLLVEMLRLAAPEDRRRVAARLAATLASMRGKDAWDKNERAMRPLGVR